MDVNLLLNENCNAPSFSDRAIGYVNKSSYLFREAMLDLMLIKKNNRAIMENYYKQILESGENPQLIVEASDGLLDSIKGIIDKFIGLIKKLVAKFITSMNSIVKSDKYLRKHKDRFRQFSTEHEFDMDIFTFTFINDDTYPNLNAYDVYKTDDFSSIRNAKNGIEYTAAVYTHFTDGLSDWYDNFRGVVLDNDPNSKTPYSSAEFSDELYKKFRNGDKAKTNTTITNVEVNTALDRFCNYDRTLRHVEKMKSDLIKEYDKIKKDIKNLTAAYSNDTFTPVLGDDYKYINADINTKFDNEYNNPKDSTSKKKMDDNITNFIKSKANQIDTMSTIHAMAFTAKLEAIKDAYAQDKKLLYAALKRINRTHDFKESAIYEEVEEIPESLDTMTGGEY